MISNPYFIAEIGVNHEAKIPLAKKLINDAKKGGADAIKLQCYKAEKLVSKYAEAYWDKKEEKENSQLKLYKKFDKFEQKDYLKLINYCKKIKIDFIVTPFDLDSVDFFKNKVKFFKISSSDITNYPLIEKIAATKKPIILSTGASTMNEIKSALSIIKKKNKKVSLLHCILNYPTQRYNANLNMIESLKKLNVPVGISDHTLTKDSHDILIYAYLKGAKIIEKHFTNNKSKPGNDHFHSFDKLDLIKFKKKLQDVNKILGEKKKNFLKSEVISRKNARRSLFYNDNLKANHKMQKKNLVSLRPNIGISPTQYKKILRKKLKIKKKIGQLVKFADFE